MWLHGNEEIVEYKINPKITILRFVASLLAFQTVTCVAILLI